jgi:hypothetical protein
MPQPPDDAGTGPERDTDEWLRDHAEMAPDESRISVEKVRDLEDEPISRLANTGDIVEDTGERPPGRVPSEPGPGLADGDLGFDRNEDFSGNEANLSTDADYSRGSGWIGGKLWGEDAIGASSHEDTPADEADPTGFGPSADQRINQAAIRKADRKRNSKATGAGAAPEVMSKEGMSGDNWTQGRDLGTRQQATAAQAFGRDVGSSGLPGYEEAEDEEAILRRKAVTRQHADWAAVLGKLGGSSPGSQENLQLAEMFNMVKLPSTREEVLQKLPPGSEFRIKGVAVDLREAVSGSKAAMFRTTFDLIDCVKDAIRRSEKLERHPA